VLWPASEIALAIRQSRKGEQAVVTERRSTVVLLSASICGPALGFLAARRLPSSKITESPAPLIAAAVPIMWAGIAFRRWAINSLGDFFRATVDVQEGHMVVRSGPYRLVRHPSYAGGLVATMGVGLVFNNTVAWLAVVGCTSGGVLYRIHVEENVLREALGAEYSDYAARTARLIPGLW
jgi:protein-S-isoprenylcysteine O-methyltransferase Ste14